MAKETAVNVPEEKVEMDDYELESKLRCLVEAKEIQADSDLMAKLKALASKKQSAMEGLFQGVGKIKSMKDLKKRANSASEDDDEA